MQSVNTNLLALNAQRRLNASQATLGRTLERLSSGLRVNSAKDDAAGLAVAQRMTTGIRTDVRLQMGIGDGVSLVQVAEGGLGSVNDILQRLRELALQSANATWSDTERVAIHSECTRLLEEIDRTADGTQIFGMFPLKGEVAQPPPQLGNVPHLTTRFPVSGASSLFTSGLVPLAYIPAGSVNVTISIDSLGLDDDLQLFTADGHHLAGTPISGSDADHVWTNNSQGLLITDAASAKTGMLTASNGFDATAAYDAGSLIEGPAVYAYPAGASGTYGGMTITYTGDGDRYESGADFNDGTNDDLAKYREAVNIDRVTENLLVMVAGSGSFSASATFDLVPPAGDGSPPPPPESFPVLVEAAEGIPPRYHSVDATPADTASLGVNTLDLRSISGANSAIAAIDQALGRISGYRAEYGAHGSMFESAINNLATAIENASASRSRIIDADFAAETAELMRSRIMQDAAGAMLAQANQMPRQVLSLVGA